jgi:hypothetical protein
VDEWIDDLQPHERKHLSTSDSDKVGQLVAQHGPTFLINYLLRKVPAEERQRISVMRLQQRSQQQTRRALGEPETRLERFEHEAQRMLANLISEVDQYTGAYGGKTYHWVNERMTKIAKDLHNRWDRI